MVTFIAFGPIDDGGKQISGSGQTRPVLAVCVSPSFRACRELRDASNTPFEFAQWNALTR